jgi:hypothetical protein
MKSEVEMHAEAILPRVYALPACQQDRLVDYLLAHPESTRRAMGKQLKDVLTLQRLVGGVQ